MRRRAAKQRDLFEEHRRIDPPQLREAVRKEAYDLLVEWMKALAKTSHKGESDEQDQC